MSPDVDGPSLEGEAGGDRPAGAPDGPGHPRVEDVRAVIESARSRGGTEALQRYIRRRLPEAGEAELQEAAEVAEEIVDSIPVFLDRAHREARDRELASVVEPLLDLAERYFLQPMDLIPEMTQGMAGLLDDAYLVLRVLQNLDAGPEPFLDWDLDHPRGFLRTLVGEPVGQRLDAIADDAMEQVSDHLEELWTHMAHPA